MPKWIKELHDAKWLEDAYQTKTVREIGEMLGCSSTGVSLALKRHGIRARPTGRPSAPDVLNDPEWLREQYEKYTSWEIAEKVGCHQCTVIAALKSMGIEVRGKGRRRRKSPYKRIIDENGKIVQEHRHIMEKHLGRKLKPNEHVHHIDGVKDNNSIENLVVLTASEHHKAHEHQRKDYMKNHDYMGFDHQCAKCGSEFRGGNRAKYCTECK